MWTWRAMRLRRMLTITLNEKGAEVVGGKMDEEDNEAGFEIKRNKK